MGVLYLKGLYNKGYKYGNKGVIIFIKEETIEECKKQMKEILLEYEVPEEKIKKLIR